MSIFKGKIQKEKLKENSLFGKIPQVGIYQNI